MKRTDRLSVFFDDGKNGSSKQLVGTLALYQNRYAAFSYSDSWLSGGFSISPFSLPLADNEGLNLDAVFAAGGSSGGARPKVFAKIDGEDWIIKFPSSVDPKEIGLQEYEYSLCAKKCGIDVSDVRLFPSNRCAGYFGTKRFDRACLAGRVCSAGKRIARCHMASASALLETSHRIPNLDYNTLLLLTLQLTKSTAEIEKLFRLMCFNVFAHNRDDHSKNFTWLYDTESKSWQLSPAYDLTYSNSIGGEHATTVDGEGATPQLRHILAVAEKNGIKSARAKLIAEEVRETVTQALGTWL